MSKAADLYLNQKQAFLDDLFEFLRIPSISRNKEQVMNASKWLKTRLDATTPSTKIIETPGNPVLLAEWEPDIKSDKTPTVLFYGHYDVQSPEPLNEWLSPPFEPTIRDERIFARGVGDNKGQLFAHLIAIECTKEAGQLSPRVKFIFDGEEELGSPNLDTALIQEKSFFSDVDLVIVSDGPADPSWKPTVSFGARGIVTSQLYMRSAKNDVHSGNFGGIQPNPAIDLMQILQTMIDNDGKCQIKGFYDNIFTPDEGALKAAAELNRTPEMYQKILGIDYFGGEQDVPLVHRVMFRPTFNICGIQSGNVREHAKTIIPKDAIVELDSRLVPYQKPEQIQEFFLDHLKALKQRSDRWLKIIERCKVTFEASFAPIYTSLDLPWTQILINSVRVGFGEDPVKIPLLGGSLPLYNLYKHVRKPMYIIPFAQPDEKNHAPNENLMVEWLEKGVLTSFMLLKNLTSK